LNARAHHDAGRAVHPGLELPFEVFAARVRTNAALRMAREAGGAGGAASEEAAIARLVGADLYLAVACDVRIPGAWERFHALYRPRLFALALAQRLPSASAADAVDDLLQDLALPAPHGAAATLLGTYQGAGSLFGWLAAILVRRLARRAGRGTATVSLDQALESQTEERTPACAGGDPVAAVLDGEARVRFDRALEDAWARCTRNERLALLGAHRHGLLHREIARLLGVGRPRVTRLLAAGVARLKEAVIGALGRDAAGADTWHALRASVENHLAEVAPLEGGAPPTRADATLRAGDPAASTPERHPHRTP
jgi:DNA-directed RNA polymerase specialized sigma24 family protein